MADSLLLQGKNAGWNVDEFTNGALLKLIASVYGAPADQLFEPWVGVASAVVATPVYTSADVSMFNAHSFEAVTNTAKVEAQVTSAGTWLAVSVLVDGLESATIAAGKIGVLLGATKGKYYAVRMKPNGALSTNGFGAHFNV